MSKSITLIGYNIKSSGGVARYSRDLRYNMPNVNYRELFKKEIIYNNKKHFGFISNILYQPFYHINTDIIHTLTTTQFYYKANVTTLHDLYYKKDLQTVAVKTALAPMLFKWKMGKLKIIVPDELVKEQVKKYYHTTNNIYVVHHGIDYKYIDSLKLYNPFTTKNNIVIAGGVDFMRRNQIYLLDKLRNTEYNVYVIGYGFMDILQEKYKNYPNFYFYKNPGDIDFYSYLKYSDLNLYNTIGEGFGYIIYESLYLGKKILINDNPDNKLLFGDYVNYYNDGNLLELVDYYFKKTDNYKNDLLKNYSIKNMVDKTLEVYNI